MASSSERYLTQESAVLLRFRKFNWWTFDRSRSCEFILSKKGMPEIPPHPLPTELKQMDKFDKFIVLILNTHTPYYLWMCAILLGESQIVQTLIRRRSVRHLIWAFTACSGLSVRKRRVSTVIWTNRTSLRNHHGCDPAFHDVLTYFFSL